MNQNQNTELDMNPPKKRVTFNNIAQFQSTTKYQPSNGSPEISFISINKIVTRVDDIELFIFKQDKITKKKTSSKNLSKYRNS